MGLIKGWVTTCSWLLFMLTSRKLILLLNPISVVNFNTEFCSKAFFRNCNCWMLKWKLKNFIQILCAKTKLFRKWDLKWDHWLINSCFLDFSIVIDSDKRTLLRAFKKIKLRLKLSPWHVFEFSPWHVFECLGMWWILSCKKLQKVKF